MELKALRSDCLSLTRDDDSINHCPSIASLIYAVSLLRRRHKGMQQLIPDLQSLNEYSNTLHPPYPTGYTPAL